MLVFLSLVFLNHRAAAIEQEHPEDCCAALARVRPFLGLMFGVHIGEADEFTAIMDRLKVTLPASDWNCSQEEWTPVMLRKAAALLGQAERGERVADCWVAGRSLTWTAKSQPGRQVAVGMIRFQNAAAARAYMGLAVDLQRKQDELLNAACADGRRVVESRSLSVQLKGVDEAARAERRLQREADGPTTTLSQVWARQNNFIVEFTWTGLDADLTWAQRVVELVGDVNAAPSSAGR
jgi:hypothetical protein